MSGGFVNGGRYAYPVIVKYNAREGAVAGPWSQLAPSVVLRFDPGGDHTPWPTPFGVLDADDSHQLKLFSWETGQKTLDLWSPARDNGLQQGSFEVAEKALFWRASNSSYAKLRVYTPSGGVAELQSFGADTTQGAFGLGTDGTDLVWQHAFGRTQGTGVYPSLEIMTAPFTVSAATLTPRRLRSAPGGLAIVPTIVGCGYAAQGNGLSIRIVRLSDGMSWVLTWADKQSSIGWTSPLALTCDELFIGGLITGTPKRTIVRVRLDSLGPGLPPD